METLFNDPEVNLLSCYQLVWQTRLKERLSHGGSRDELYEVQSEHRRISGLSSLSNLSDTDSGKQTTECLLTFLPA